MARVVNYQPYLRLIEWFKALIFHLLSLFSWAELMVLVLKNEERELCVFAAQLLWWEVGRGGVVSSACALYSSCLSLIDLVIMTSS